MRPVYSSCEYSCDTPFENGYITCHFTSVNAHCDTIRISKVEACILGRLKKQASSIRCDVLWNRQGRTTIAIITAKVALDKADC